MGPRIALIIPPSPFLADERVMVSLGVLKVAAAIERAGMPVDVLDCSGVSHPSAAVRDYCQTRRPTVLGWTATTPQIPDAVRLARVARSSCPSALQILGGPHPTLSLAAVKRCPDSDRARQAVRQLRETFDVVVAGDGERAIFEAIRGRRPIIDADDPSSPLWIGRAEQDANVWPARHLVDLNSYHYTIDGIQATTLIAQLGCPFGCGFCGGRNSPMLRRVRTRSAENILAEMRLIHDTYGYRGIMFYDDELNVSSAFVELLGGIRRMGIDWRLRGFLKAELLTQPQADAMAAAGFRWVLIGFESGAPRILENINKRATREENSRAVATCHRAGLQVKALMSLGHPGETLETVRATRDWLLETRPDDMDVTIITPYPGSPYFDEARAVGPHWTYRCPASGDALHQEVVDYQRTADYYKGLSGHYVSHVWTDSLTAQDVVRLRDELEAEVRTSLSLPVPTSTAARLYEHSMGALPPWVLRSSVPSLLAASEDRVKEPAKDDGPLRRRRV